MRLFFVALLACAASPALAQSTAKRAEVEARQFLAVCPAGKGDERDLCLYQQKQFVEDYVSAKRGVFDDQKNVAYMLQHGTDGAVAVNMREACAWQIVIIARGEPSTGLAEKDVALDACAAAGGEDVKPIVTLRAQRIDADIRQSSRRPAR